MTEQPLFTDGELARDEAIANGQRGASPEWIEAATKIVTDFAERGLEFSADNIWSVMTEAGVETFDGRSLGGIFRKAARDGRIRKTGRYVNTIRPEAHARPIPVWIGTPAR